ncbi:hypothetical protein AKO64_0281 [Escherichia coli]|nr:hypothetical protein AKO64_0281 [Escherichia coli]
MMGTCPDQVNHFSGGTGSIESRYKEARLVRSGLFFGTLA